MPLLIALLATVVAQYPGWRDLRVAARGGVRLPSGVVSRFVVRACLPPLGGAGAYALGVVIEDRSRRPLIPEPWGRIALPLVVVLLVLAVVGSVAFGIGCAAHARRHHTT